MLVFFVKVTDIPGKKRGRYIPKYYVFRGFHLSTCYPWPFSPLEYLVCARVKCYCSLLFHFSLVLIVTSYCLFNFLQIRYAIC